ncbi:hypothetical protein APSETT444_007642 [Aspergillus pseudonomiae]
MVTRGLWNLHVDGKWYRWFHLPRGQSTSPDSPTTLRTLQQILSRTENFKWDSVPFPTPLHFQLDYVYTIDEDAGHFMLTEWKTANQALHQITRKVALASIRETLQSTIDTLLDDAGELSKHNDHSLSDIRNETNVEYLLNAFGIKPSIPTRLNELQFQLFIDFVYTWRFYFDDNSTWERSFSLLSTLAIGLLRIAAWDLEVRNMDTEELPITFSSLPRWKAPIDEIFWFHKYLIVCCNTDQIGTSVATKAKDFARSGIHQFYRAKRERKACSVMYAGKTTDFRLRVSKPSSRRPELWLIRTHDPPPPRPVDYTIFFNGVFSGLAYGFDE